MGIVIYTKGQAANRKRAGKDLFKEVKKLRKLNKILLISNLVLIGYLIYENF